MFITSGAEVIASEAPEGSFRPEDGKPIAVLVKPADGRRCDRCWGYFTEGSDTADGGFICPRCKKIVSFVTGK